jgi:hypothetical protein
MQRQLFAVPVLALAIILAGCANSSSDGSGNTVGPTNTASGNNNPGGGTTAARSDFRALFVAPVTVAGVTAAPILPYPTDLFFSGSTDGTLNLPANALQPGVSAVNALDGYSTTAPILARFSSPIDPTSLTAATVRVIRVNVDNTTKATVGVSGVLVFGTDYSATVNADPTTGGSQLSITPLRPLTPSSGATNVGYLVVLTNGIRSATGAAANADTDFETIKAALPGCTAITNTTLNGICRLTAAHFQIAGAVGINTASVIQTFSFSTQNTRDTMNIVAQQVAAGAARPISARPTGLNTQQVNAALQGKANVWAGTLQVPYYLSRTAPLSGSWQGNPSPLDANSRFLTRFNPVPVATENLTIPVLYTVPNASSLGGGVRPGAGWPVVIFQHGITGNRTQALAIADALADAGFLVASIDQTLHGLTDTTNPLYATGANPLYAGPALAPGASSFERTFDLDLVNNTTTAPPGGDGRDPSGTHFINLTSLLTSRDNLRQSVADLLTLTRALPTLDLNADTVPDVDGTKIYFVGISLGGIAGTTYAGLPSALRASVQSVPGGGIAYLLRDSNQYGPIIRGGLTAAGLPATAFDQYFRDTQTVVDSGDPLNYIASAVALRPLLLQQVTGDTVVPNNSTQRLIDAAALTRFGTPGLNAASRGWVNMIAGSHGSLLSPATSLPATVEMQTQAATFVATDGAVIRITNGAVVQP